MSNNLRFRSASPLYPDAFPPGVKWLLIANVAIFFLQGIAGSIGLSGFFFSLELSPRDLFHFPFPVWQLFTHMFLHGGLLHILFNMLTLYWFGPDLERTWGTRRFLDYYFLCGVGAGICVVIAEFALGRGGHAFGASGALFGVLIAYGMLFPNRTVLFFFVIPMKIKHMVWVLGLMELYFTLQTSIASIGHLGGLAVGYLFLKSKYTRVDIGGSVSDWYRQWKMQRAKKKFQVYMRKHGGPGGTTLQ